MLACVPLRACVTLIEGIQLSLSPCVEYLARRRVGRKHREKKKNTEVFRRTHSRAARSYDLIVRYPNNSVTARWTYKSTVPDVARVLTRLSKERSPALAPGP